MLAMEYLKIIVVDIFTLHVCWKSNPATTLAFTHLLPYSKITFTLNSNTVSPHPPSVFVGICAYNRSHSTLVKKRGGSLLLPPLTNRIFSHSSFCMCMSLQGNSTSTKQRIPLRERMCLLLWCEFCESLRKPWNYNDGLYQWLRYFNFYKKNKPLIIVRIFS